MKALSVSQLRALDQKAKDLGLQERILIENASSNLYSVIDSLGLGKKALVVAGRGNNGADALSCARKLASRGYSVRAITLENKSLSKEVQFQKSLLDKIKIETTSFNEDNIDSMAQSIGDCDFILEGILGIGIKGQPSPFFNKAIKIINDSGKKIVACDVPSGLLPDDGALSSQVVKANYTVSFIGPKKSFSKEEVKKICGKIFIVDIGISRKILESLEG